MLRRAFDKLDGQRRALRDAQRDRGEKLARLEEYLSVAPDVEAALKKLGEDLFGKLTKLIEEKLTLALQEVLSQPICLKVVREFKRGGATMGFHIERGGEPEDIMRGQGGSVANVLSVGLRIFALAQSDPNRHRRFLVLDEQDCWLAPELVPRLVKIIHDAGKALGFQTLLISHHDPRAFEQYADRIYRFAPAAGGVNVEDVTPRASHAD
jgi:hypothetical protein